MGIDERGKNGLIKREIYQGVSRIDKLLYTVPMFTCHCCDIVYGIEKDQNGDLVYKAQNVLNRFEAEITGLNTVRCGYCGFESELDPSYPNHSKPIRFNKKYSDITLFNRDSARSFFESLFKSLDLTADVSLDENRKSFLTLTVASGKSVSISVEKLIESLGIRDRTLAFELKSFFDDEAYNKEKELLLQEVLSKLGIGKGQMGE